MEIIDKIMSGEGNYRYVIPGCFIFCLIIFIYVISKISWEKLIDFIDENEIYKVERL